MKFEKRRNAETLKVVKGIYRHAMRLVLDMFHIILLSTWCTYFFILIYLHQIWFPMTLIRTTVSTFHIRDIRYEIFPSKLSDTRRCMKLWRLESFVITEILTSFMETL